MINPKDKIKEHSKCHKVNKEEDNYFIVESEISDTENECEVQSSDEPTHSVEIELIRREFTPVEISANCEYGNLEYKKSGSNSLSTDTYELEPPSIGESMPNYPWKFDLTPSNEGGNLSPDQEEVKISINYGNEGSNTLPNNVSITLFIDI